MNSCTLHPPNSQIFSDDVIGSVMQRAWIPDDFTDDKVDDAFDPNDDFFHASAEDTRARDSQKVFAVVQGRTTATTSEERTRGVERISRRKPLPIDASKQAFVTNKVFVSGLEHQRELRRMRQNRYRKKKYDLAVKLEKGTVQLRKEVEELEQRRCTITAAVPTNKSVWDVALQYFQVSRFGVQEPLRQLPTESTCVLLNFLLSTMTEDVVFNSSNGVEAIMQTYKSQTFWFKDFELELEGLVKSPSAALVAITTTSFIITERTLHKAFPHLSGKDGSRGGVLKTNVAKKLLGQRIIARGRTRFEWDAAVGRVSRVTTQSDLLTPTLRLLGNLEDTSLVFGKALVSPDFLLSRII